jgi:hypothetical protein
VLPHFADKSSLCPNKYYSRRGYNEDTSNGGGYALNN